jgi:ATP-dependent Clp protease adaptor protein ClpS
LANNPSYNPAIFSDDEEDIALLDAYNHNLIVWNDEVNSFDWVIETLIVVCGHQREQAEQCAMLIHTKGKYAVKNGSYEILKLQCDAITERMINATVE